MSGMRCEVMEEKTLRIKQEHLDKLLRLAGDVVTYHMEVDLTEKNFRELKNHGIIVPDEFTKSMKDLVVSGKKTSDELVRALMEIRMVPVSTLFNRFIGMVRDISRNQGKKVDFVIEGDDTLVDKTIAEKMADPLIHMLRNAADHGVEPYEERLLAGKPELGRIVLGARADEDAIFFYIQDDGRGLNFPAIIEKAVNMKVISQDEVNRMTNEEMGKLIFHPGLSTAKTVTDISGRGVGMDVVKKNLDELKAEIRVLSEKGKGTSFDIKIPKFRLVDIIDAIIVIGNGRYFGVPIKDIHHIISHPVSQIHYYKGRPFISTNNEILTLYKAHELLEDVLEYDPVFETAEASIVVLEDNGYRAGLVLDEILGVQTVVIKKAGGISENLRELMGVAGIGKGKMANVINSVFLLDKLRQREKGVVAGADVLDESEADAGIPVPEIEQEEQSGRGGVLKKIDEVMTRADIETLGEILTDIGEHLQNINQDINRLESDAGPDLYGRLFRGVHSCKGAFGALKLDALVQATNHGEDLLGYLRDGRVEINETIVDFLFQLTTIVETAVDRLKSGYYPEMDTEVFCTQIQEYKEEAIPPEDLGLGEENVHITKDTPYDHNFLEVLNIQRAIARGGNLYDIFITVNPDTVMKPVRAVIMLTDLFHQGEIIASLPSVRAIERSEDYEALRFIYATEMSGDELGNILRSDELVASCEITLYEDSQRDLF